MKRTILITGATDGIGLETAKVLAEQGHTLIIHGRSESKLRETQSMLTKIHPSEDIDMFIADFSRLEEVVELAKKIKAKYRALDVLLNNAGVFKVPCALSKSGIDLRFLVNTFAPYVLTKSLRPLMNKCSRVINVASAAQASVELSALKGWEVLSDSAAYAQSKLAMVMWSFKLAQDPAMDTPNIIAVNPASFLGSKMVKEAYGTDGKDLNIGADILTRLSLNDEFSTAGGRYFDNDIGKFTRPHSDALSVQKNDLLVHEMNALLIELGVCIDE